MIPTDPQEREALAGEYVLGTLDARLADARWRRPCRATPALRAVVAAWEARLAPLTALAPPEAPPPDLWRRIEAALPGGAPAGDAPLPVAPAFRPPAGPVLAGLGDRGQRAWPPASPASSCCGRRPSRG